MDHSPSRAEQDAIDALVSRYNFEFVSIRLTKTMLKKSIIDAGTSLRAYLKHAGIVEYPALALGAPNGIRLEIPMISSHGTTFRQASFYRPVTKRGDSRFWIAGLNGLAEAGDLLLVGFTQQSCLAIVLSPLVEVIARELAPFLPLRGDRTELEAVVRRLAARVEAIRDQGWLPTLRAGDTGVGFTLETLLGIAANTIQVADHEGIELKAHRLRTGAADPLITLFGKTPSWGELGGGTELVRRHGYRDEERRRWALYCTITTRRNSLGWKLVLDTDLSRVRVLKDDKTVVHYTFGVLQKRLLEKHPSTLFVAAQARGKGVNEEFLYSTALYCRQPSFGGFLSLVEERAIGLDFTVHLKPNGKARDHGYLWRIRESRIPDLYAYQKQLL